MTSLRRSALIWMTILLTVVGAFAFVIAYEMARREASDFLDGQFQVDNLPQTLDSAPTRPVSEIRDGLRRAALLVNQLLRMARLEEPHSAAAEEIVDLSQLVTECVGDLTTIAEAQRVDLGIVSSEPTNIHGRYEELRVLFGNVIDNAVRYTPAGGVVDVSVGHDRTLPFVEVVDTGCGISPDKIGRVFDRFFRAAPPDIDGSGLGLSIAAAIAKRHHLRIAIENRQDRSGLRVRVSAVGADKNLCG
jgi:two-component system, OmpR family, sensor kinase